MSFLNLPFAEPVQRALTELNYTIPTPIQEQTIPLVLAGEDVLGCAQTGTGKTAAFALPILHYLSNNPKQRVRQRPRVLVLAPTRELAGQIKASFEAYGKYLPFASEVIFGGVSQVRQERAMLRGPEVLVATPGRLLDLMRSGHVVLGSLEILVLDEADRMLDMGFIHDVRKIIDKLPTRRQTLFFSATMPSAIIELSQKLLTSPKKVMVTPESTTAERIDQTLHYVPNARKREALTEILKKEAETDGLTLVFSATKHGANRIVEALVKAQVPAAAIHGNKSQGARERALGDFRDGRVRVLVATDIAARGIDVKGVSLVVNYDLPREAECYVHRIGRTARAGADGRAISLVGEADMALLKQIERVIRGRIPVAEGSPFAGDAAGASSSDRSDRSDRSYGSDRSDRSFRQQRPSRPAGPPRRPSGPPAAQRPASRPMAAPVPAMAGAGSSSGGSRYAVAEPRFSSQRVPGLPSNASQPSTATAGGTGGGTIGGSRFGRYSGRRFRESRETSN